MVPDQLCRESGIAGIEATRVRHDEDGDVPDGLGLRAGARRGAYQPALAAIDPAHVGRIEAEPDQGHDARLQAHALADEDAPSTVEVARRQLYGGTGRAGTNVGERDAELGKVAVILGSEQRRRNSRRVQQTPEGVAEAGEVVAYLGRAQARVDSDQQQPRSRRGHVVQTLQGQTRSIHLGDKELPLARGGATDREDMGGSPPLATRRRAHLPS